MSTIGGAHRGVPRTTAIVAPVRPPRPEEQKSFKPENDFVLRRWKDLSREFPGQPIATEGTRYVVLVPTCHRGRHGSPETIAQRVMQGMGNNASRVDERVRLVVYVNRLHTVGEAAGSMGKTLKKLADSLHDSFPMRTSVVFTSWHPKWTKKVGGKPFEACHLDDVRDYLNDHPEQRQALLTEEREITKKAPMGLIRTDLSEVARHWQKPVGNERVITVITDSDTTLPPDFFARLDELPEDVRVVSGGYAYDDNATPLMRLQNGLDMHIRAFPTMDKRLVYLPEPCLAVDTTHLAANPSAKDTGSFLKFGSGDKESRAMLNYLASHHGELQAAQIMFDRGLQVSTNSERFGSSAQSFPQTFSDFLRVVTAHSQSHAGVFTWMRQLSSMFNVCPDTIAPMATLFSVPHIMEAGLVLDDVETYVQTLGNYFDQGRWHVAPASPFEELVSEHFNKADFTRSAGTLQLALTTTRTWATATLDFLRDAVQSDKYPEVQSLYQAHLEALPPQAQGLQARLVEALAQRLQAANKRAATRANAAPSAHAPCQGFTLQIEGYYVSSPPHPGFAAPAVAAPMELEDPAEPENSVKSASSVESGSSVESESSVEAQSPPARAGTAADRATQELWDLLESGAQMVEPGTRRRTRQVERYRPY